MIKKIILSLAILAATLAVGFWFGRNSRGHGRQSSQTAQTDIPPAAVTQKSDIAEIAARIESECRAGIWRRNKEWEVILNSLTPVEVGRLTASVRQSLLAPA